MTSALDSVTVPSEPQLSELQHRLHQLQWTARRLDLFKSTKQSVVNLLAELDMLPCSWFDKAVLTGDENSFIPTADNMDQLQVSQRAGGQERVGSETNS